MTAAPQHHRPGGGYRNPPSWPRSEPHGFSDFLRWRFGAGSGDNTTPREPDPPRGSLPKRPPAIVAPRAARGYRSVTWVGHSTLLLQLDALPEIDLVLLSHNHYDHLDAPTVRRIADRFPAAAWLCPMGLGRLLRSWGVRHLVERDWWQSVDAPGYTATCTPAQHFS